MTQYASKRQPDRFPYRVGKVRLANPGTLNGEQAVYAPRDYDPAMTNEPNPGLIAARYAEEVGHLDAFYGGFTEEPSEHPMAVHTIKVLTRVINLRRMKP